MTAVADTGFRWLVRPADLADLPFVVETSLKARMPKGHHVTWSDWEALHGDSERAAIKASHVLVVEALDVLLGFLVADGTGVVRMLYVKRDYRGHGIGLDLLRVAGVLEPVRAWRPTGSWRRWCRLRGIEWREA